MLNSYNQALELARKAAKASPRSFIKVSGTEWAYYNDGFYSLERDDDGIFPTLKYCLRNDEGKSVLWFTDFDEIIKLLAAPTIHPSNPPSHEL